MRLYMVTASYRDYDEFDAGVVYANGPEDAIAIVREECAKEPEDGQAYGAWYPIDGQAVLHAAPVERKRGAVLGHGRNG